MEVCSIPHDEVILALDRSAASNSDLEDSIEWREALGVLPPDERLAVALRVLGGWDFRAIGEMLHVSHASAHRMVRRALAALPSAMGALEPGHPGPGDSSSEPDPRTPSPPPSLRGRGRPTGPPGPADIARLVAVLHSLAARDGTLPGRRRIELVGNFRRADLARLMRALENAGVVLAGEGRRAGRLADATPDAALARLAAQGPEARGLRTED